jgi:adenosylhomocysteine nucleosidase
VEPIPAVDRIAFVCAMPMEVTPLVRKLSLTKAQIGGISTHVGTLGDRPVVAAVTGMGTRLARTGVERLLDAVPVAHVVVVGITGAVENVTPIGTLVVPEVVVHAVAGTEHHPAPLGHHAPAGTMWTADELITDLDALAELRARGVVSLDMETAAVAQVCTARGIPWSVFRAISDRATDGTVDDEVFRLSNQDGTPNGREIVRYFARHPGRVPRMMRLARGARQAADTAADAAIRACSTIPT